MGRVGRVYRRVRSIFVDSPTNFGWIREGKLAASGRPFSEAQFRWVAARVDSILSLTESPLPQRWFQGGHVRVKHIPLADHKPVAAGDLFEAVHYIDGELESGRAVLVHCLAGKGRTGSVVAAYLMATEGKSARDAIEYLRSRRPGSVERGQDSTIVEFERLLKKPSL